MRESCRGASQQRIEAADWAVLARPVGAVGRLVSVLPRARLPAAALHHRVFPRRDRGGSTPAARRRAGCEAGCRRARAGVASCGARPRQQRDPVHRLRLGGDAHPGRHRLDPERDDADLHRPRHRPAAAHRTADRRRGSPASCAASPACWCWSGRARCSGRICSASSPASVPHSPTRSALPFARSHPGRHPAADGGRPAAWPPRSIMLPLCLAARPTLAASRRPRPPAGRASLGLALLSTSVAYLLFFRLLARGSAPPTSCS